MSKAIVHLATFLIFMMTLFAAQARKPAVEPVMGISIDQRDIVLPEDSKSNGFDFSNAKRIPTSVVSNAPKYANDSIPVRSPASEDHSNLPYIVFFLFLLFMPVAIWIGVMKRLKQHNSLNNTVDLSEKRNEKKQNDLPKAS